MHSIRYSEKIFECKNFAWDGGLLSINPNPCPLSLMLQVNCLIFHSAGPTPLLTHLLDPSLDCTPLIPHTYVTQFS